ncbi:MAG: energy transducer TonB [Chromatiales bacterium]|nr:energy transducer TonB [Chromatiales bacterium]
MPSSAPLQPQRLALLTLIFLAHVALLWALSHAARITPPEEIPSAVIGMLVMQTPVSEPTPEPIVPPPPMPKPVVRPKPTPPPPLPVAPPSERAVTAPEPPAVPVDVPTETVSEPETPVVVATTEETKVSKELPVTLPQSSASFLHNPKPEYPLKSRRLNEQGTVILEVYILADGTVGEVKLKDSSGYPRLDESALRAVQKWHYVPAKRGDEPIAYWYRQTVEFNLKSG